MLIKGKKILRSMIFAGVIFFMIFSCMFVSPLSAQQDTKNSVSAQFDIRVISGTILNVNVTMIVERMYLSSTMSYTYSQIQALAASNERADIEIMGALKLKLQEMLDSQLHDTFSDAQLHPSRVLPVYQNSFFYTDYLVVLTSDFFAIPSVRNVSLLVDGIFDMGGVVTYSFLLHAAYGWNNTYTFILPDAIALKFSNTAQVNSQQNRITWTVSNWNNQQKTTPAQLSLTSKKPTTSASSENISLVFSLDTTPLLTSSLQFAVDIHVLNIREYGILPSFVSDLSYIPADGIRLFISQGLFSWDDIYSKTVRAVEQNTVSMIEISTFNQSLDMHFSWNDASTKNCSTPFNISHMDSIPAVRAEFIDRDVDLRLCGMSTRAFFGLINAGASAQLSPADINFGDKLDKLDYPYDVYLYLPERISLQDYNVFHWNKNIPFSGLVTSEHQPQPPYKKERIDTYIEVDIKKMELNVLSFFSGKTELTGTAYIKEVENIYVAKLHQAFALSKKINLSLLNSDTFRVCIEEGVFTQEQIEAYLLDKNDAFQQHLANILKGSSVSGIVDRTAFLDSLQWDKDVFKMDDRDPVVFSAHTNHIMPVSVNISIAPPYFSISEQTFLVSNLGNENVTYRIVFPVGITITTATSNSSSLIKGRLSNGQEYVEVFFQASSDTRSDVLKCGLEPSPVFLLSLFLPCILSCILLVVLIVILYLIRRRRHFGAGPKIKKQKKEKRKADAEETGYEGEDFYIPPPPPSSR